jgi:hypothetical protein
MQRLLDNGFCPVDKTLKVSFSFAALKHYSCLSANSKTTCSAFCKVRPFNVILDSKRAPWDKNYRGQY